MKKLNIAIGLSAALAAWAYLSATPDLFGQERSRMENAVAAKLRDPSSAEFRNVMTGADAMCGEVNGTNALGGYTGFKSFVYQNGIVLFEPEQPAMFDVQLQTTYYQDAAEFARVRRRCYD